MTDIIEWDIDVSILTNRFIMSELLRVLGIAVILTACIVLLITVPSILSDGFETGSSNMAGMKYALMLVGSLFLLTVLFIFAYYGNRYMLSYELDNSGVRTVTRDTQRRKNNVLNSLLIILGLLARNPAATGTGFLASSGQDQMIRWQNVKKATFYPSCSTIKLSSGFGERGIVFCTKENYSEVSAFVRSMCSDSCRIRER